MQARNVLLSGVSGWILLLCAPVAFAADGTTVNSSVGSSATVGSTAGTSGGDGVEITGATAGSFTTTISNGATVSGNGFGAGININTSGTGNLTVNISTGATVNAGASYDVINGGANGITLDGTNSGTTSINVLSGAQVLSTNGGNAMDLTNGATVSNAGTVTGGAVGIYTRGSSKTYNITNTGTISANSYGITGGGTTTINNYGTITTTHPSGGTTIATTGNFQINNQSGATISASNSGKAISRFSGGPVNISNAGTITAGSSTATAIDFSSGTVASTITNTGTITGKVILGNVADVLQVNGGSVNGTIDGTTAPLAILNVGTGTFTPGGEIGPSVGLAQVNVQNGGTLALNQNVKATNVSIQSGGRIYMLAGRQITGALSNSGTLTLGSHTLTVTGAVNSLSGSTIATTITGSNSTDLGRIVSTGGAISLATGTVVAPTVSTGVTPGPRYVLATGNGAATVGSVTTTNSQGYTFSVARGDTLGQDASDVYLVLGSGSSSGSSQSDSTAYSPAGSVVTQEVLRSGSSQVAQVIAAPVEKFLFRSGGLSRSNRGADMRTETGLNAGDGSASGGLWLNGQMARISNSKSQTKYLGTTGALALGGDYTLDDTWMMGLALTPDYTSLRTKFNSGEMESRGFTVSPYLGVRLTDSLGLTVIAARSWIDYSQQRNVGGSVSSAFDAKRDMVSASLGYSTQAGDWGLGLKGGYRWVYESAGAYAESDSTQVAARNTHLGEVSLGGQVSRAFGDFEPYVGLTLLRDVAVSAPVSTNGANVTRPDRTGIAGTLGFNYLIGNDTSVSFEVNDTVFESSHTLGAMLNLRHEL